MKIFYRLYFPGFNREVSSGWKANYILQLTLIFFLTTLDYRKPKRGGGVEKMIHSHSTGFVDADDVFVNRSVFRHYRQSFI